MTNYNNVTKLENMINPQVMANMISAKLPHRLKFLGIAQVDSTLQGVAGSTITIPFYKYIGDATDVQEGASIDLAKLTTDKKEVTIKKAAKAVAISDEAVLSGYGDPIGEATGQLMLSLASKMDADIIEVLDTTSLSVDTHSSEFISYNGVVDVVDKLAEEGDSRKVLFVHPKQVTTLRKDPAFIDRTKFGGEVMMTGAIGSIAGCEVIVSKRVKNSGTAFTNYVVVLTGDGADGVQDIPAVKIFMKKRAAAEKDRDILADLTVVKAHQFYAVGLTNESKVIKVQFKSK